jgi:tetratricopeptide (TPR) repeat protein
LFAIFDPPFPNYTGGPFLWGRTSAQRDASQFDAAIESFRIAGTGTTGLAIAQVNHGAMLREAGKTREAIDVFRDLLARHIDAPKIAHNLCVSLMSIGEDAAAVDAGKLAVADDPDFDDYNCYGGALLAYEDYEASLVAFEKSLTLNPRGVTALAMINGALAGVGRDDDVRALVDFGRFLKPLTVRTPAGYEDLAAFNNAIYDEAIDFPGQPGNERQTLDLAEDPQGALATLKTIIQEAVAHYVDQTPDDPGHPFTAYKPKQWDLHIWATREKSLPYQFPHIHPHGWVSGIYYPRVPKFSAPPPENVPENTAGNARENTPGNEFPGHVEFLRFLQFSNRPVVSESVRIPAEEGLMVLFPPIFITASIRLKARRRV